MVQAVLSEKSEVVCATHKHVTRAPQNQLSPNPWFSIQSSPILSHCHCVGWCISISRRQHYSSWYDLVSRAYPPLSTLMWDEITLFRLSWHHNATRLILVPTVGSTNQDSWNYVSDYEGWAASPQLKCDPRADLLWACLSSNTSPNWSVWVGKHPGFGASPKNKQFTLGRVTFCNKEQ